MARIADSPSSERLARVGPRIKRLPAGTELWRVYLFGGSHAGRWNDFRPYGPVLSSRFDHHVPPPRPQDRAIMYAATEIATCLAEVFHGRKVIDRWRCSPWLVGFSLQRELVLHDLSSDWLGAAGVDGDLNSGSHSRGQRWSHAIHDSYPEVQGLWYPSVRHPDRAAIALYERAKPSLPVAPFFHRALSDPVLLIPLKMAAARLDLGLV
ncbi:MAG TPA: RES family NAD+ phosphorylase [Chloroflexota bacterium]|nr:RES family NAD+ phosphorylase [Chloroflexota bacterium]